MPISRLRAPFDSLSRNLITMDVDNWLNESEIDPYSISISEAGNGDLSAYVPVSIIANENNAGDAAFAARMLYWPSQTGWGNAHEVRLVWMVQMLTDECIDPDADLETCARQDTLTVINIYDDEWELTGLQVSEEQGMDVAIMYEDPTQDPNLDLDEQLWPVSWNLTNTFLRGRDIDGNGERDVRVDNLATEIDAWAATEGDTSYIGTETFIDEYPHADYVAQIMMTETVRILDTAFAGYENPNGPNFVVCQRNESADTRFVGNGRFLAIASPLI